MLVDLSDCFFFNDPATTEIYTYGHPLSLHDALPICRYESGLLSKMAEAWVLITQAREGDKLRGFSFCTLERIGGTPCVLVGLASVARNAKRDRSEEHTSELQSLMRISYAVFCLKKKKNKRNTIKKQYTRRNNK